MPLLETLARMISNDSTNFVQFGIPAERVLNVQYDSSPVHAGGGYFRVWAVEMKASDNHPLANYYPVLHSVVRFDYAGKTIELTRVNGLDSLKSSVGSGIEMSKVVALNFALTELVPFNGGNVEISAGLLAMKEKDKVAAAIKLAGDFSSLLAVPQLSTVLAIAQPLARNIENIVGLGETQFRLGYHNTFTSANSGGSNDLTPQYIAIIAAQQNDNIPRDGAGHWVVNDHLVYIDPATGGSGPSAEIARDYMLLRLEVRRTRGEEWAALTNINAPFIEALRVAADDQTKASAKLKTAIMAVLESPDIAENDREAIALLMRTKYKSRVKILNMLGDDDGKSPGGGLESVSPGSEFPGLEEPNEPPALPEPASIAASLNDELDDSIRDEAKALSTADLLEDL